MNLRKQMWGSLRNDAAVTYLLLSFPDSLVVSGGRGALGLGLGADRGPLDYTQYFSDSVPSQLLHEPLSSLEKSAPYSSVDMVACRPQRPHMTFSIRMRGVGQPRHTKSHAACAGHSE